jgi:TetR/AcrR family tetracycline transcriptional repressor
LQALTKTSRVPTKKRSPAKPPEASERSSLNIEIIVETAVRSIEKLGLAGVSMRQLAAVLDVTPTALYHHVRDKNALLDLCAESILSRIAEPDPELPWPQRLRALIVEQQATFMRYPGLARFLLIHRESSLAALRWAESLLSVLNAAGFGGEQAMRVMMTLSFLINPLTLIDDKVPAKKNTQILSRTRVGTLVRKNPQKLRFLAGVLPHLEGISYENHFVLALDRVIAGIEREAKA